MSATPERKLTTLLAADVAGYSRLMEVDEEGTHARLDAALTTLRGFIANHRGRVVNTAGDGLLAEFASVVEAVRCAVDVQRELGARNAALPADRQLRFRIGINLGDVIVENGDLFGEGVNVAARLQALADPGGICIAGAVHEQVKHKLTVGYDFLGDKSVKNISEPVAVYRVDLDGAHARRPTGSVPPSARTPDYRPPPLPEPPPPPPHPGGAHPAPPWHDRRTQTLVGIAAFLFAIDFLSDGSIEWAYWPALGLAFAIMMRTLRR